MKNLLKIIVIAFTSMVLTGCSSNLPQNQTSINSPLKPDAASFSYPDRKTRMQHIPSEKSGDIPVKKDKTVDVNKKDNITSNNEETVVINVDNFGRTNPFKPFQERNLLSNINMNPYNLPQLSNVPVPPIYIPPKPELTQFIKIKVNGILYDPGGSSAIINVNNNDYLVHKGEMIFGYYIKNITADKITVKYGSNIYTAGIGEIVEGAVKSDPVKGINQMFGGSQRISALPTIRMIPSLNK